MLNYNDTLTKIREAKMHRELLKKKEVQLKEDIHSLTREDLTLEQVAMLFRTLHEDSLEGYAKDFARIVEDGMRSVFYDQDLAFSIELEQKRGKVTASFITKDKRTFEGESRVIEGDPLKSFGGGVAALQSLLLRVLVLLKNNMAPYLILDESLAAMSEDYIETTASFLKALCQEMGVHILLVTHNKGFLEYADNSYMAEANADGSVSFKTLKGGSNV
jgi:ABC-type dipeptide/oligopeptide/nickel transport system ATPase subunit